MSNQERLARKWAENVNPKMPNEYVCAARDYILNHVPAPTMADAEWEHEKHHLAGANYKDGSPVVMIDATGLGEIYSIDLGAPHGRMFFPYMGDLIPNGKRYELREITEPEHPEVLSTVEDYENAPEGTIVASNGKWEVPYMKQNGQWWASGIACDNELMARNCHPVLREGWGA